MTESMRQCVRSHPTGRGRPRVAAIALVVATVAGCATTTAPPPPRPPSTVTDSDFARLTPDQIRLVDEARQQLLAARDELGRAKLDAVNVQHEGEFARSDQAAASAGLSRAAAEAKVGQDSNEPGQKQRAREEARDARQDQASADAHLAYSKKLAISRAAQVTAGERKVALMTERVNLAKLKALDDAGVPALGKYDRAAAVEREALAERAHLDATVAAALAERETAAALTLWKSAAR
jgi:hypothetical protein